jgi:uncharacterized protein YmfQ (DUF2313 family)
LTYVPTRDECADMLLSLMPPGRASQRFGAYVIRNNSQLKRLLYALSGAWYDLEVSMGQLINEYSPATATQNLDLWKEDYGLPNACDPFGDNLVTKVGTTGGSSIQYYTDLATALGWHVDMRWLTGYDPVYPGIRSTLYIGIHSDSPTVAGFPTATVEDSAVEDAIVGDPDLTLFLCVMDELLPAHAAIIHEVL